MTEPVLRLEDIVVRAGERPILEVDDFRLAAGETLALIGPNGAGKSTLLHVAALLRRPDRGTVMILGQTATLNHAAMLRRALSVVFQEPFLFDVSVLANAAAGLRFQGMARREAEIRARIWLERFGVAHLAERRARRLSGGEASRVALARAFATEPAILLLDEPFAARDAPTRATLLPVLGQRLRETGTAAVLVTHDLTEAFAFGDGISIMQRGRILACGDASAMLARPPSREVAELLGIETILSAKVIDNVGPCTTLELLPGGPQVHVQTPSASPLHRGQTATVTLPAAASHVLRCDGEAPAGWNRIPGNITSATPLPTGTRLVVATPVPIVAFAPWDTTNPGWDIGEQATVTFPPSAPHVIPTEG